MPTPAHDAPPTTQSPPPPRPPVLTLTDIGIRLGGRQILDQVSFSLAAGEFTGLIGSNGAGKTTLLRIIMGLRSPDEGVVRIGPAAEPAPLSSPSASSSSHPRRSRSRREPVIGYVPQKILIQPDAPLRARDLVALGLDGHRFGPRLPSRSRRELVDAMLAAVDAERFAEERVGTLSGGEQQRVLIAHALIGRPRLLLMDEPLANLDLKSGQEIVDLVARVAREQRVAVLLSAHDMNPLLPVMDKVVYIAEGRAAAGTTDEVVRSDVLSALYRHPVSVLRVDGRVLVVAGSKVVTDLDPSPAPAADPASAAASSADPGTASGCAAAPASAVASPANLASAAASSDSAPAPAPATGPLRSELPTALETSAGAR